jgi:phage terminase small subunit
MTLQQEMFCKYYVATFNASKAARLAGYSIKTSRMAGYELLQNKNIKDKIKEMINNLDSEIIASQNEILSYMTSVLRDSEEMTKDRIKCAELLGKKYGLFDADQNTDKQTISIVYDIPKI